MRCLIYPSLYCSWGVKHRGALETALVVGTDAADREGYGDQSGGDEPCHGEPRFSIRGIGLL